MDSTIFSISQVSKAVGVTKQTLYKKISKGLISCTRTPDGKKGVELSEMERVFGPLKEKKFKAIAAAEDDYYKNVNVDKVVSRMEQEIQYLRSELNERNQAAKETRMLLRAEQKKNILLLEHQSKSFWRKIFGPKTTIT